MDNDLSHLQKLFNDGDITVISRLQRLRQQSGLRKYARILEPGKMCSTYMLEAENLEHLNLNTAERESLLARAKEEAWPEKMRALQDRMNSHETIKQFRPLWVGEFSDTGELDPTHAILEISPNENRHMPPGFQMDESFYIVFQSQAVELLQ